MTDTYTVTATESGERIDALLAHEIDALTRSQAARLIADGAVTLRCEPLKKNHRVSAGDVYVVCHTSYGLADVAECDQKSGTLGYNGNDAFRLRCATTVPMVGCSGWVTASV